MNLFLLRDFFFKRLTELDSLLEKRERQIGLIESPEKAIYLYNDRYTIKDTRDLNKELLVIVDNKIKEMR